MNPIHIMCVLIPLSGMKAEMFAVVQKLPTVLAEEGQTVLLPCDYTANVSKAIGSYSWYRDTKSGTEVSSETSLYRGRIYRISEDFGSTGDASILIKDVRLKDSGMYYCEVVMMQLGVKYGAGTHLIVKRIEVEMFAVVQKLPTILAEEGQTVLLPCDYTANVSKAIGSYSWYRDTRNGTEVSNETSSYKGRIYRISEDFGSAGDASILIKDVRLKDSGLYYCEVMMMQLGVKYGAGTHLIVKRIEVEMFAVVQKLPTILAEEGQTVLLPCDYTANVSKAIGSYSWYRDTRNGTEVSNETSLYKGRIYRISEDFGSAGDASILIKDVRLKDSGVYYCEVMMMQLGVKYGAGTHLIVKRIEVEMFAVVQKLPTILAEEGQTVLLPCDYTANVSKAIGSYSWYRDTRNGTEVSNETSLYKGRIYRISEDFGSAGDASILIKDVRLKDSGVYYCEVMMMQLGVKYGAGTHLIVKRIEVEMFAVVQKLPTILAEEGQTVLLPCDYTANVSKAIGSYSWYRDTRNGTEVSNETSLYKGRIYRISEDFGSAGDASILIKDVRLKDSGVYYCEVIMMQLGVEYGAGTHLIVKSSMIITVQLIVRGLVIMTVIIAISFWRMRDIRNICSSVGVLNKLPTWRLWRKKQSRWSDRPRNIYVRAKVDPDSFKVVDVKFECSEEFRT